MLKRIIVFTGGGTAGHIMPNISIIEALVKKYDIACHYIGLKNSIEEELIKKNIHIPFHVIHSYKFNRGIKLINFFEMTKILQGIAESKAILSSVKPDLIFSKGGYVAFPVIIAGFQKHIPMIAHESDITPGLANRWSARFVDKILTTFPETVSYFPGKSTMVGTPIRDSLFKGSKETGYAITHFSSDKPVLIVIGGSQGSLFINQQIRGNLFELLRHYHVLHICGSGHLSPDLMHHNGYYQTEFAGEELSHFYAIADMAISRAGANTIMELAALNIPNILIPLSKKYSRGDQIANASSFEHHGLSIVLHEDQIKENTLLERLDDLWSNKDTFIQNMNAFSSVNVAEKISDIIVNFGLNTKR